MSKPLILVSNDDGITSKGIRVLVSIMKKLGEVVVVAPDSPQSGMGHAITIGETLRLYDEDIFDGIVLGAGVRLRTVWRCRRCGVLRVAAARQERGSEMAADEATVSGCGGRGDWEARLGGAVQAV